MQVDTSNILFVCGGAFAGLDRIIRDRSEKGGIGFGAEVQGKDDKKTLSEVIQFRREIAENRKRFLTDKERELKDAIAQVMSDITALERKRQQLYNLLREKGAFDSIRHTYEHIICLPAQMQIVLIRSTQPSDSESIDAISH